MRETTSTDELLAELRAADPLRGTDLSRVDPDALTALRVGVLGGDGPPVRRARHRWSRRALAVGGVVALALAGGTAYAGYQSWYSGGGGADGITCTLDYGPMGATGERTSGGPVLTGDPIADCAHYQELVGLPAIPDPVAFRDSWHPVVVAPADQVPADASVLAGATAEDLAVRELLSSTYDLVDGPAARCSSVEDAWAAAQADLDRLGLTGWQVTEGVSEGSGPCPGVGVDTDAREVQVAAGSRDSLETWVADGDMLPEVLVLRDALRTGIADVCVDLDQAEAVVTASLGTAHHWPTTSVEDRDASCTRVDLEVGGSVQITLRGPRGAARG